MAQSDINFDDFENDPAGLRKAIRALQQRAETAEQRLADVTSESRNAEIDRRFKEAGIPEKAKKLIGSDTDLDAWFDEFGDVLGSKDAGGETPAETPKVPAAEPTAEEQRAKATLDSATPSTPGGSHAERLRAAASDEEREQILREGIAAINAANTK